MGIYPPGPAPIARCRGLRPRWTAPRASAARTPGPFFERRGLGPGARPASPRAPQSRNDLEPPAGPGPAGPMRMGIYPPGPAPIARCRGLRPRCTAPRASAARTPGSLPAGLRLFLGRAGRARANPAVVWPRRSRDGRLRAPSPTRAAEAGGGRLRLRAIDPARSEAKRFSPRPAPGCGLLSPRWERAAWPGPPRGLLAARARVENRPAHRVGLCSRFPPPRLSCSRPHLLRLSRPGRQ